MATYETQITRETLDVQIEFYLKVNYAKILTRHSIELGRSLSRSEVDIVEMRRASEYIIISYINRNIFVILIDIM